MSKNIYFLLSFHIIEWLTTYYSPFEVIYGFNPLKPLIVLPDYNSMICYGGFEKAKFVENCTLLSKQKLGRMLVNMLNHQIQ